MSKRLTDTNIWDKEWFMKLNPTLKCLVKFVWDKCDLAGVWCPNWTLARMYVGGEFSEEDLLKIDEGKQFIKLPNGKIFSPDFIFFQNGNLGSKSPIHIKIKHLLNTHSIPYPYTIDTPIVIVGVRVEEEVIVKVEGKISEILESERWIQDTARVLKSQTEKTRLMLIQFLDEQKIKDNIYHREISEIKDHFVNWFKLELQKEKKGKNGQPTNFENLTTAYNGIKD